MAKKLYLLIGLFTLSILVIIALSWVGMHKLNDIADDYADNASDTVQAVETSYIGPRLYQIVADSVINGNLEQSAKTWQDVKGMTDKQMAVFGEITNTPEEIELFRPAKEAYANFVSIYETEMLPLLHATPRNPVAITATDAKLDHESQQITDTLGKIKTSMENESSDKSAYFNSVAHTTITSLIVVGVSVLVVAVLLGLGIIHNVLRQLGGDPKEVAQVVNTMAVGDFSISPRRTPVAGSLLANAYQMQSSLKQMITSVMSKSNEVEDMARSLAAAAMKITDNTHHESDAVSSMAASIEELSVSTTHISDQGGHAKQIADASHSNAETGAEVVNKTVTGLLNTAREIESASSEVSRLGEDASRIIDVAKVIKEIADQTNLLALNAAIEAARAGEQGRGFAVVADEVRKLAERTGNATNEINQMSIKISEMVSHTLNSMEQVVGTTRQGVTDAKAAQDSIVSIQESFGQVANVIDDISSALSEQNTAATDLAKNTERVAQMSEENSGASRSLLSLAHDLEAKSLEVKGAVAVFKV